MFRGGARLADLGCAFGLFLAAGPFGPVLALLYLLFADGLMEGQSVGKRMFGIKAIYLPTRTAARFRESVLRNAPFGFVVVLGMMPELGGAAFVGGLLVVGTLEAWKVIRDGLGLRLGDRWAQTQVVDGKVVAGEGLVADGAEGARAPGRMMYAGKRRALG
jgi:hypothetical protein